MTKRTIVLVGLVVAVGVAVLGVAVTSGDDGDEPLPDSTTTVTADRPLTSAQAAEIREAGRALTTRLLDRVPNTGENRVDTDQSEETWRNCTAEQKDFTFEQTRNGVQYSATVFVTTPRPLTDDEVRAVADNSQITTREADPGTGTSGIFSVELTSNTRFVVDVASPCYPLPISGGGDYVSTDDILRVTGFVNKEWAR